MESLKDMDNYLKQNAPDITIKPPTYSEENLPEHFNTTMFGENQAECTHDMIMLVKEWLMQPIVEDKAENDAVRIHRENNFPEEIANTLKNHRAHPKQITPTLIALNVLIRNAEKSKLEGIFAGYQKKLNEAAEWYRIFSDLRNHAYHIHTRVWQEVIPLFTKNEKDIITYSPYEMINSKIAQQIKVVERIAMEMLQKLEK